MERSRFRKCVCELGGSVCELDGCVCELGGGVCELGGKQVPKRWKCCIAESGLGL